MMVTESSPNTELEDIFAQTQKYLSYINPVKAEVDLVYTFQKTTTIENMWDI